MKKANKEKVYEAYNEIADWFDSHRNKELVLEKTYLDFIQEHMLENGTILDVGCGTGEPIAKFFIEHGYKVTGVDASIKMIEVCRQRFPAQRWIVSDMRTLKLQEKFNLVIAWHSLFHLPHADQKNVLKLLASYVEKGGLFVFTSGSEYSEEWGKNGGYDLYHASLSIEEYKKILAENNFKILLHKIDDPDCGEATVWIAEKIIT